MEWVGSFVISDSADKQPLSVSDGISLRRGIRDQAARVQPKSFSGWFRKFRLELAAPKNSTSQARFAHTSPLAGRTIGKVRFSLPDSANYGVANVSDALPTKRPRGALGGGHDFGK